MTITTTLNLDDAAEHMTRRFGTDWSFGCGATRHGYSATVLAGSEAEDSPMVGGAGHGIDDTPAEALRQAFEDFGYRPTAPLNEIDMLAATTEHLDEARAHIDEADRRLRRSRWYLWIALVCLGTAILLYVMRAVDAAFGC